MERKLASIQRVMDLQPIPDADRIERVTVQGWNVVVRKGDFQVGDKCVYLEIDSLLPKDVEWAQFMEPRGFRVKTAKLRKCLSQGLVMPLNILHASMTQKELEKMFQEDEDVTELLGVTKYEPPIPVGSMDIMGDFPGEVPKTDEMRLQSVMSVLEEMKTTPFFVTVKCDGMSGTFFKKDGELVVTSRNWRLEESDSAHWRVAKKYNLDQLPEGAYVQGEVCGPGIQKNRLGLKEHDLFIFNVGSTLDGGGFLDYDQMVMFCIEMELKTVPFDFEVDNDELPNFPFTLENFLELAKGNYAGTQNRREGIVIRPTREKWSETLGGRLSFKVINNDFLLKDEE